EGDARNGREDVDDKNVPDFPVEESFPNVLLCKGCGGRYGLFRRLTVVCVLKKGGGFFVVPIFGPTRSSMYILLRSVSHHPIFCHSSLFRSQPPCLPWAHWKPPRCQPRHGNRCDTLH